MTQLPKSSRSGMRRLGPTLVVLLLMLIAPGPVAHAAEAENEIVVIDQTILIVAYGTDDYDVSVIATIVAEPDTVSAFADEVFNDETMIADAETVLVDAGLADPARVEYQLGDLNLDNDVAGRTVTFTPLSGADLEALMREVGRDVIQSFDIRDEGDGTATMDVTIEPLTVATEAIGTAEGFEFIPSTALNVVVDGVEVASASIAPEDDGSYLWLGLDEDPVLASITFADTGAATAPDEQGADDQPTAPAPKDDTPRIGEVQPVAPGTTASTSSGPPAWFLILLGVAIVALVGTIIALLVRRGGGGGGSDGGGQQYPQQPWAGQPQGPQGQQGPWPGQQGQPQGQQPWPNQPQGPWQGQ